MKNRKPIPEGVTEIKTDHCCIIQLKDGALLNDLFEVSADGGLTWERSAKASPPSDWQNAIHEVMG